MAKVNETQSATPSSGTTGFFQQTPKVPNSFHEDEAYKRVFTFYLPASLQQTLAPDLSRFASRVLHPTILTHTADAERHPPTHQPWSAFGHRVDNLHTSSGWRTLSAIGIEEGIVAIPYEHEYGPYSRLYQFLKYHLWTGSCAIVTCPSAMTDGAAKLLRRQLSKDEREVEGVERAVFEDAYKRLVSRDPDVAWTSGQWMTERAGGSDVRGTETLATYSPGAGCDKDANGKLLGSWSIDGFKWFSSATDSQMTVLLAKTPDGGLSAFYAPMHRVRQQTQDGGGGSSSGTELNGIQIQRLKSKLGTRSLPTAELILSGMRAYPIGKPGAGVKEISTILNITRVHNAVSAVGFWGRGLAISRAFARVRRASGKLLTETPAHVRTLAHQHVEYRAMMHLTFFAVALLGLTEDQEQGQFRASPSTSAALPAHLGLDDKSPQMPGHLLRIVTPIAKALTARATIAGLAECMESLGGVGYLENDDPELNIARLYRDANVLSIWEGTTNVMADDTVRVLKGRDGQKILGSLNDWIRGISAKLPHVLAESIQKASESLKKHITTSPAESLKLNGRTLLSRLGWLVGATLLAADATRDGDDVAWEFLRRWVARKDGALYGFEFMDDGRDIGDQVSSESVEWDRRIVFGGGVGKGVGGVQAKI